MTEYVFTKASQALPVLLDDILTLGEEVGSRGGRVKELRNVSITLTKPECREILTPGRHASYPAQIAETAWVLAGRDDIEWLSHYLPRAPEFSDDGKTWRGAYGPRIRDWYGIDQLKHVVDLLTEDPTSRRAVIQIYNPVDDINPGKDIPCNNWLHFLSRLGELHLHVAVRSNDVMWGWSGINAFEWSVLQEIVASMLGIKVGELHFSISSLHLYERHWAKAREIVNISKGFIDHEIDRYPYRELKGANVKLLDDHLKHFFEVEELIRTGHSDAPSKINAFPEPLFRSWLRVLQAYWTKNGDVFAVGARAREAYQQSPVLKKAAPPISDFLSYVIKLHNEKHAAYGDSWKRRGEMLGIMANIARKIDRLGGGETADENSADTAIDLLVYLAKYRTWLSDYGGALSDDPENANKIMVETDVMLREHTSLTNKGCRVNVEYLTKTFDRLEDAVNRADSLRHEIVRDMLNEAYRLARTLWESDQDEYRGADHD